MVGIEKESIIENAQKLLDDKTIYEKMAIAVNPYGDGDTSKRIVNLLKKYYERNNKQIISNIN